MTKGVIAVDYDDTITVDKEMWIEIISIMKKRNFTVVVVTFRIHENDPYLGLLKVDNSDMNWLYPHVDQIIFTGGNKKKKFCEDIGIKPIIWIDDKPEWIVGSEAYKINI